MKLFKNHFKDGLDILVVGNIKITFYKHIIVAYTTFPKKIEAKKGVKVDITDYFQNKDLEIVSRKMELKYKRHNEISTKVFLDISCLIDEGKFKKAESLIRKWSQVL